jgi:hypothetical protein
MASLSAMLGLDPFCCCTPCREPEAVLLAPADGSVVLQLPVLDEDPAVGSSLTAAKNRRSEKGERNTMPSVALAAAAAGANHSLESGSSSPHSEEGKKSRLRTFLRRSRDKTSKKAAADSSKEPPTEAEEAAGAVRSTDKAEYVLSPTGAVGHESRAFEASHEMPASSTVPPGLQSLQDKIRDFAKKAVKGCPCAILSKSTGGRQQGEYFFDERLEHLIVAPARSMWGSSKEPTDRINIGTIQDIYVIEDGEDCFPREILATLRPAERELVFVVVYSRGGERGTATCCLLEKTRECRDALLECLRVLCISMAVPAPQAAAANPL